MIVFKTNSKEIVKDKNLKLRPIDILLNKNINISELNSEQKKKLIKDLKNYVDKLDKEFYEHYNKIKKSLQKKKTKHERNMKILRFRIELLEKKLLSEKNGKRTEDYREYY